MIINKLKNSNEYIIKLLDKEIDIYNPVVLEKLTEKMLKKILKNNTLKKLIILDIYTDKNYGTIIVLKDYNTLVNLMDELEVKIHIHTDSIFLYKVNNLNITKLNNKNIYYYKNNFYIEVNESTNIKDYLPLLEEEEIIYENSDEIINKGIKINI